MEVLKIVCNYANILMLLSAQNVFKCFILNFINIISLFSDLWETNYNCFMVVIISVFVCAFQGAIWRPEN